MKKGLVWFRRDLRVHDHYALAEACRECDEVIPVFIFDEVILKKLKNKNDYRVTFIAQSLIELQEKLPIQIYYGDPKKLIPEIAEKFKCQTVYTNRDYEQYAIHRDISVGNQLLKKSIHFKTYKDSVFYEKDEILTKQGTPYKVFTPYKNSWLEKFNTQGVIPEYKVNLKKVVAKSPNWTLEKLHNLTGFNVTLPVLTGGTSHAKKLLKKFDKKINDYKDKRDFPSIEGTSNLSVYIRHGNISVRDMVKLGSKDGDIGHKTWLSEVIWRDFYQMLLVKFPHTESGCFNQKYDDLIWPGDKKNFTKWCQGKTGYPLVDAAMRCLNKTGQMHNRLRMVVASFLCKTLLLDWKLGEAYFAEKLLDFDKAANNGGWQWASSTGCDAQPYFRVFNPWSQSEKFDKHGEFIKEYCPELKNYNSKHIHAPHLCPHDLQKEFDCIVGKDYPEPIIDYKESRLRAISLFKNHSS